MGTRPLLLAAMLIATLSGGCVTPRNDGMAIGGRVELQAFRERAVPPAPPADAAPSLTTIDRSAWEPMEILVPTGDVVHHPAYVRERAWTDKTARQRGEYPTAESALELTGGSQRQQRNEALVRPFGSILGAIAIVPRMFFDRPWKARRSPTEWYRRYWIAPEASPAPAPDAG